LKNIEFENVFQTTSHEM